jgi:putative FmdB family regulatory protein
MPIYEYLCSGCGHEFEKLVFRRDQTVVCPACGIEEVEKKPSVFGFASRGSDGGGRFVSSSKSSSCSGCASSNCSSCH